MCNHVAYSGHMTAVGIRELRHDASALVQQAQAGAEIEVTVQGRPAAMLVPLPASRTRTPSLQGAEVLRRLAALRPARGPWLNDWIAEVNASRDDDPLTDPWPSSAGATE